jgi:formylglycine-generating enzyme required for sulfatase activity
VGSFPLDRTVFGCLDMGGNVSEWVDDYLPPDVVEPSGRRRVWTPLDRKEGFVDPRTPPPGVGPMFRGGAAQPSVQLIRVWIGMDAPSRPEDVALVRRRSGRATLSNADGEPDRRTPLPVGLRIARDP